jgi:hypothetical protein
MNIFLWYKKAKVLQESACSLGERDSKETNHWGFSAITLS